MQRRVTNATVKMSEFIQVKGTKKDRERIKTILVKSNKKRHVN